MSAAVHDEIWQEIVRSIEGNTELVVVDVPGAKTQMDAAIAAAPDQPVRLEPLWDYMLARGAPEEAAADTLFTLYARAPRLHVEMTLPPDLAEVTVGERARRVARLLRAAPAPKRAKPKTAEIVVPAATRTRGRFARLFAAGRVVAMAAALVGAFVVLAPDDTSHVARALGPLCSDVVVHGRAALCTATPAALANRPHAHERAQMTGVALGLQVLFVDQVGAVLAL